MENVTEKDLRNFDVQLRINRVSDITNRIDTSPSTFDTLPKNKLYSLYIDYTIPGAKPHKAEGLNREQLRSEILSHLAIPSHQLTNIYIAPHGGTD